MLWGERSPRPVYPSVLFTFSTEYGEAFLQTDWVVFLPEAAWAGLCWVRPLLSLWPHPPTSLAEPWSGKVQHSLPSHPPLRLPEGDLPARLGLGVSSSLGLP